MSDAVSPGEAPAGPVPKPRRRRRLALSLAVGLGVVALGAALAVGALLWSLHHARASAWLIGWVPGLHVVEPRGSLIGDFAATRVVYTVPGVGTLRLDAPHWRALSAERGDGGRWLHIVIDTLHADRVVWTSDGAATPSAPTTLPRTLRLPVEVEVREANIDELRIGGDDALPVRGVRARVHLGADGGARHRLDELAAGIEQGEARGAFAIGADAPFVVEANVDATATARGWSATMRARGPLEALDAAATVRAAATAGHAAQSLDARARIRPLAAWPLGDLDATVSGLDLSAFASALPATALTGEARATTTGTDSPATVSMALANARAGRWNEGFLPVRRLRAELRARPNDPSVIEVNELSAELGSASAAAGSIVARGRWAAPSWRVDAELRQVQPAALDARAASAVVNGTAALTGTGFAAAVDSRATTGGPSASAPPAGASSAAAAASSAAPARVDLVADLAGELTDRRLPRAAPRAARLRVEAGAGANDIELRRAEATLGDAAARLDGRLTRSAASERWRAAGRLELARFDPAPWWPGATDSPLGRGVNRLNAKGEFDLLVPAANGADGPYAALAATTGRATLAIIDSVLAGVALQGTASYANSDGRARASVDLLAAGNRVQLDGTMAARGGSNDDWRVAIDAPRLDALAPLLAAPAPSHGGKRTDSALSGSFVARGHVSGRWPQMSSDGELLAKALRIETVSVRQAAGRWRVSTKDDGPLEGHVVVDGVDAGGRAIDRIQADLSGTARSHRAEVRVASALLPPAWTDALVGRPADAAASAALPSSAATPAPASLPPPQGASIDANVPPTARSIVTVVAEGSLVDVDGSRAAGWRGTIREAVARSLTTPATRWLDARDVRGRIVWGGAPLRVTLDPASAHVLGATVRWSRVDWQQGGPGISPRLDAEAEVDAIAVAPILQALQPGFGWGGDLRVGARLKARSTGSVSVDMVVERTAGDLSVTDEISSQRLGLSDLRFGVAAADGVWHFTAAAAGATLGVASAAVTARTSPSATWPAVDTPLQGVSELRVDSLGTWGPWLAPGWRLGGRLHASASIGGRVGAPEYTGHVEGTGIAVRNFVEGVNVTDGTVAIALRGTSAHIETFTAKAGSGTLAVEGDAAFDESPTAQLRLALDRFELLTRVDRRIAASGTATMRLDAKTVGLDGSFNVDDGLIDFSRSDAPTLGSDVEVVRRPRTPAPPPDLAQAQQPVAAVGTPQRDVRLDVRVDMGNKLRIRGRGLDAGLRGELRLTTPSGRLAVNGALRTVDGTYRAYGQNLEIERGVLTFAGPVENPRLDIEATRPNLDVRVGVAVTGSALNPRVRLFSEPELSEVDKLSWLVLGRASETSGGADTALLQQAALALLSGEGPGVTEQLIKSIGLDEISVRQSQQGAVKDTVVSLGKQISKRWYVGYERGLNTTLGNWQLIYRVAQRITVRAETGSDNAIDVIWTWRWK
ncbi:MAG TPA: translocation/assembly module TamB domain-containing protein [Caldimonas sp.]|nr:translocation/assembly module TamB domain-containing protein [Caldimonas sp.]